MSRVPALLDPFRRPLPVTSIPRRTLLLSAATLALSGRARSSADDAPTDTEVVKVATRFGAASIPRSPRRVISIYDTSADFAVVLGLPLVGLGGSGPETRELPAYQRGLGLDDLPKLSTYPEPDIEGILGLQPDLVLDDFALDEVGAAKLQPLVAVFAFDSEPEGVDWRALLRQMAAVFGAEQKATDAIAAYDERAAAL